MGLSLPLDYFNQSQLNEYLMCGHKYKLKYIDGHRSSNLSMIRGTAVHHAAASRHIRMKLEGEESTEEEVAAWAADRYDEETSNEENIYLNEEEKKANKEKVIGATKDTTIDLALTFAREIAPRIKTPIIVEETIEFCHPSGLVLKGTLDLVHKDDEDCISLADLKTASRRKNQVDADISRQLTFYSLLYLSRYKTRPDVVELQVLVANKKPTAQFLRSTRVEYDIKSLLKTIEFVVKNISAGVFGPASDFAWWCTPKQCELWHRCKFTGGSK